MTNQEIDKILKKQNKSGYDCCSFLSPEMNMAYRGLLLLEKIANTLESIDESLKELNFGID